MGHITVCCDFKNEIMHTTYGSLQFDVNGECKLDSDVARQVLAKYKPTMWAKKSGKPEPVAPPITKTTALDDKKNEDNNFGFDPNVHVSKAARKALAAGQLAPEEIMAERQKAMSVTSPPVTTLDDDLMQSGAAAGPGGAPLKKAKVVDDNEDESVEPVRKFKPSSKSAKVSGKRKK